MPIFKKIFTLPACIMYNTMAEKRLVNRLFNNQDVHSEIAGVGVDLPENLSTENVKQTLRINSDYILYVGRIDVIKITDEDFDFFLKFKKESKKDVKLVLIGNLYRNIPKDKSILYLGFVNDETKFNLMRQSLALFQPSKLESLSMVVLEAFTMKRPVIVHSDCEVMRDHVEMSQAGYYYNDYDSFKMSLQKLVNNNRMNMEMGEKGNSYVMKHYHWDTIVAKFINVIEKKLL